MHMTVGKPPHLKRGDLRRNYFQKTSTYAYVYRPFDTYSKRFIFKYAPLDKGPEMYFQARRPLDKGPRQTDKFSTFWAATDNRRQSKGRAEGAEIT